MPTLEKKTLAEGASTKNRILDFFCNHSKKSIIALVILTGAALTAASAIYYYEKENKDVLAKVGDLVVTRKDFNQFVYGINLIGSPEDDFNGTALEEKMFLDDLLEKKVLEKEAIKAGYNVSESEVTDFNKNNEFYNNYTEEQKRAIDSNVKLSLLTEKYKKDLIEKRSGEYLLFRFDKYFLNGEKNFEGEGDNQKIEEQKKYAKMIVDEVSRKLESKQLTFEDAKNIIINDPVISNNAFLPVRANFFGDFDGDEYDQRLSYFDQQSYEGFFEGVKSLKTNEISKPITVKGYPTDKTTGEKEEIFYAIIKLNKIEGGKNANGLSYDEWYNEKLSKSNTVIFYAKLDESLENKLYKISSILGGVAKAEATTCTYSISGTHNTAYNVWSYYRGSDNVHHPYQNNRIIIRAGSGEGKSLKGTNTDCNTLLYSYSEATRYTYNTGRMQSNWAMNTDRGWSKAHVAACGETSTGSISLYSDDPVISGTVAGAGDWDFITSSYNKYGITGQSYDGKWLNGTPSAGAGYTFIKLDMGTSTSWANGTTITKRAIFKPHWNSRPTTTLTNYNGASATPTPAAPGNITLVANTTDPDSGDMVQTAIGLQKKVNGVWGNSEAGGFWLPYNGSSWGRSRDRNTTDPRTFLGTAGEYRWCAKSKDSHGAAEGVDGECETATGWGYFTVSGNQTCSLSSVTINQGEIPSMEYNINGAVSSAKIGTSSALATPVSTTTPGIFRPGSAPISNTTYYMYLNGSATSSCQGTVSINTRSLGCRVEPIEGLAPLAVRVLATTTGYPSTQRYDYIMGDGSTLTDKPATVYYTYSLANRYTIGIKPAGTSETPINCINDVTVKDESSGSGGEVAP